MAENSNNAQERDPSPQTDKENQPNPLEQNQPKKASRKKKRPLQESQSSNLPDSTKKKSRPRGGERRNGSKSLDEWYPVNKKSAQGRIEAPRSAAIRTKDGSDSEQEREDTEEPSTTKQDSQSTTIKTKDGNRSEQVGADTEVPPSLPQKPKSEGHAPSSVYSLSFKWIGGKGKIPIKINVNPHETIIDGLKNSKFFVDTYKASQHLSIYARHLHAMINHSAPCGGLKGEEELELRQINVNVPETPPYKTGTGGLFIKVHKKGNTEGGAVRVILHHNENNTDDIPMAVFGYGDETFEEALRNDKRFLDINVLSLIGTKRSKYENTAKLSLLPSDTYTLIVPSNRKKNPEASSGLTPKPSRDPKANFQFPAIESKAYEETVKTFVDQFNKYVRTQKSPKNSWRIIKKDFSYNIYEKSPMTARIIQILEGHFKHVAWILVKDNGRVINMGTFFLLTESLGLTCYHVVKEALVPPLRYGIDHVVKEALVSPGYSIEINFNYYTDKEAEGHFIPIIDVLGYDDKYDYAFLRIPSPCPGCPGGLLQHLALPPQDRAVAIIGHPQGQVKKIDFCSVINFIDRKDSIVKTAQGHPSYVHVLTQYSFLEMLDRTLLTYRTCLYEGASGAPVFNERGELVAMHSGGYSVDASPTTKSLLEFGRSMIDIIIMGAVKIEDLRCEFLELAERNESLTSYMDHVLLLPPNSPHMEDVIKGLKILQQIYQARTQSA